MIRKIPLLLICFACLLSSCADKDEIKSTGTLTFDGVNYNLTVAVIHPQLNPMTLPSGAKLYETEVGIEGAASQYLQIHVMTSTQELKSGTYIFTAKTIAEPPDPGDIYYCRVSHGPNTELTASKTSTGKFTVKIDGKKYTFDLSASMDGHQITVHYEGEVHIFSPT